MRSYFSIATANRLNQDASLLKPDKDLKSTDIQQNLNIHQAQLSKKDFDRLSRLIMEQSGIKMPPEKHQMLTGRLKKRLKALAMGSFTEYCDFLFSKEGQLAEMPEMLNVVTTNKTDFFREAAHFDFLTRFLIPEWYKKRMGKATFQAWSAGCSSGEEPYTLAMVLAELQRSGNDFDYEIRATDLSTDVLKKAVTAIYPAERIVPVPMEMRKRYLLKSKDKLASKVRIVPQLRNKVTFSQLNLLQSSYRFPSKFDLVMCRNVMIYFDRPTQEQIVQRICNVLKTGGFLFIGHSESIGEMKLPLKQVRPTMYVKT